MFDAMFALYGDYLPEYIAVDRPLGSLKCAGRFKKYSVQKSKIKRDDEVLNFFKFQNFKFGIPSFTEEAEDKGTLKYDREYPQSFPDADKKVLALCDMFGTYKIDLCSYLEAFNNMVLDTSCGFPFNLVYKDKKEFIQDECIVTWMDNLFEIALKYFDLPIFCFNQFMKDEIRLVEKLKEGKIRQINGSNILFLAFQNILFKRQNEAIKANHLLHPSAIGMSLFSKRFRDVLGKHSQYKFHVSCDVDAFDASVSPAEFAVIAAWRGINSDESLKLWIQYNYRQVCFNPLVTTKGFIYLKRGGNPSGQFNTGEDNSCCSSLCWYDITQGSLDNCYFHVYGDDGIYSTNDVINEDKVKSVFDKNGKTVRDLIVTDDFMKTSFLQRSPVKFRSVWVTRASNPKKMLESLIFSEKLDNDTRFQRAVGMRIAYFFNEPENSQLKSWIKELRSRSVVSPNLLSADLSDDFILKLYTSYESTKFTKYSLLNDNSLVKRLVNDSYVS